ncbi:zinc ribbon domain-containing protein [Isoptericola sp. b490]|nr:FmdB family zinc ribbon protein [Isoptericola sp. b490]MDO8121520.1 zinc ribbon domain-containing protein [Isoptericola sp. b490]
MPTYSYACTECGHRFDAQQAFTDDALTQCPQCGGRLRKLFGSVGVVFKGPGFYRTDARDNGRSKAPSTTGSTPGSTSAPGDAGSGTSGGESSGSAGGSGSGASGSTGRTAAAAAPA